jgi:hypothetical protein
MKKKSPRPTGRDTAIEDGYHASPLHIAKVLAPSSNNSHRAGGGLFEIEFSGGKRRKCVPLWRSIDFQPGDNLSIH